MTPRERLTLSALRAASRLACRLPERPLHQAFHALGAAHYLLQPGRRDLARRNLQRICDWLVAEGRATPRVARAAGDRRAMDRLVRDAFGHHARYYLELLRQGAVDAAYLDERIDYGDWDTATAGLDDIRSRRGLMYLGLHYGPVELPARAAVIRTGVTMLVPMEVVADRGVQAWAVEQRLPAGVELVDPTSSGRRLVSHARDGGLIGIVCDRPIGGASRSTTLFGAAARLPAGPAMVALGTGVRCQMAVARRTGFGTYELDLHDLALPREGTRSVRVAATLAIEARAMEAIVAKAPEQWWTVLFPIWDDIR